jgi:hypothetical protein
MRVVSAREPPTLPSTLIRSKGTSRRSMSATWRTALTAIWANCRCSFETLEKDMSRQVEELGSAYILLSRLVMAVLMRFEVSVFENWTRSEIRSNSSTATLWARSKPSAIRIGWIPLSSKDSACSKRAPARTRTKFNF